MRHALLTLLVLLAALPAQADECPRGRTPNLCMKPTAQQLLNDNFSRIDETLGGMMSDVFNPANNGKVFDRGGAVFHVQNKIFGAACDGTTDDAAAIAKALGVAATVRGTVLLGDNCAIGDTLDIASNVTLQGGRLVALAALGNAPAIINATQSPATDGARDSKITIKDVVLDLSASGGSTGNPCVRFNSVVDGRIENVTCIDPGSECVYIGTGSPVTVRSLRTTIAGLKCSSPGRNGVAVVGGVETVITGFQITSPTLHGIDLELESASQAIHGVAIGPGTIDDVDATTTTCGINIISDAASQTLRDVAISGVTITDPGTGIGFRGVQNLAISGVTIRSASGDGILTHTASSENATENVSIGGGVVIEDPGGYCVNWNYPAGAQIGPLVCKNSGAHGIRVSGSAVGVTLTGVTVDTTAASQSCISVGDATDTVITGGRLIACAARGITIGGSSACTGTVISGVRIDGTTSCIEEVAGVGVDFSTIVGNDVRGCTAAINPVGASTVIANNQGYTRTAAQLASLALGNGSQIVCSDCAATSGTDARCTGSGLGSIARRAGSVWSCDTFATTTTTSTSTTTT
jgi:hypothetical protein